MWASFYYLFFASLEISIFFIALFIRRVFCALACTRLEANPFAHFTDPPFRPIAAAALLIADCVIVVFFLPALPGGGGLIASGIFSPSLHQAPSCG
jgi:hypothetical protein